MSKLTDKQIEAIQNQQPVYNIVPDADDVDREPTDYLRRYINAYRNKDYSNQINKD